MRSAALILAFAAARLCAQGSSRDQSVFLTWANTQMLIAPDVEGLYLWANSGEVGSSKQLTFGAPFDPALTLAWLADARDFLDIPLGPSDTGSVRISPVLDGTMRGRVYLARRHEKKGWTADRYVVMLPDSARMPPLVMKSDEKTVRQILDSLEAVSKRAPKPEHVVLRDSTGAPIEFDHVATVKSGAGLLRFPDDPQLRTKQAMVLVRFVVGIDGKVDLATINIIHSTAPAYLESALEALTRLRFKPATSKGAPVRQLMVAPFEFNFGR
jgi:TonB family protein